MTETIDFGVLSAGMQVVSITVLDSFDALNHAPLVLRFRLFNIDSGRHPQLNPLYGYAANGEVEDYIWHVPTPRIYVPIIVRE